MMSNMPWVSQALPPGVKRENLSKEELEAENKKRSPRNRFSTNPEDYCGARLNEYSKERLAKRGIVGEFCQQKAGAGTPHAGIGYCKYHGGNTKAGIKHAAKLAGKRIIKAEKDLMTLQSERFGGDRQLVQISPEEALLEEVRRSVAMVRWLEERIGQWRVADDDSNNGTAGNNLPALVSETSRGAASFTNEREWLLLYRQEREHAAKTASLAIGAGIAERMVHLAEDQGRMLAIAVRAVLDAMNLSPEQIALVPTVVPNILRQVSTGMPIHNPAASPLPDIIGNLDVVKRPGVGPSEETMPQYIRDRMKNSNG